MTSIDTDCANAYRLLLRAMVPRLGPLSTKDATDELRRDIHE